VTTLDRRGTPREVAAELDLAAELLPLAVALIVLAIVVLVILI
jgi:hypothetical protein